MKTMNNFWTSLYNFLDLKVSLAGIGFLAINITSTDVILKIIGSVLFIGYTIDRWYHLRKNKGK